MSHWAWLALFAFCCIFGALWAILKQLEKLNEQIGNVRYFLREMEERQQLIRDDVYALSKRADRER